MKKFAGILYALLVAGGAVSGAGVHAQDAKLDVG